jgi:hypothetical protein
MANTSTGLQTFFNILLFGSAVAIVSLILHRNVESSELAPAPVFMSKSDIRLAEIAGEYSALYEFHQCVMTQQKALLVPSEIIEAMETECNPLVAKLKVEEL